MTKKTERKSCKNCKFKYTCIVYDHLDDACDNLILHCTTVKGGDKIRTIFNNLYREIAKLCKLYKKGS